MSFNVVVLASGTGSLFQSLIEHQGPYQVQALITDNPAAPAFAIAAKHNIKVDVCELSEFPTRGEWNDALLQLITRHNPDLVVSAGFMKILGPTIVDSLNGKLINIHPSLLPKFPGAHAVQDALNAKEQITGSTVHYVDSGVDTGMIIAQREVSIYEEDDVDSLHERIKEVERTLIVEVVTRFALGAK